VTNPGADTFVYDQANRLTSATVGGTTTSSVYDPDGKRLSTTVGANPPTTFTYDVNQPLPVVLQEPNTTPPNSGVTKYVWGMGLAYAVDLYNNVQVYHTAGLGTVRAITDGTGNLVQTYQTDAFGVPTASRGTVSQPFQYTGEQRDPTGLIYLRARFYDPAIGRFMSRDPFAGVMGVPLSLNRYSYVLNNPVNPAIGHP